MGGGGEKRRVIRGRQMGLSGEATSNEEDSEEVDYSALDSDSD